MAYSFNSSAVGNETDREVTLRCRLNGFTPANDHADAEVIDNTLIVTANIGDRVYQRRIPDIDVTNEAVRPVPANDQIDVIITKPYPGYSLASKLP